jgi:hypothetical protein
VIKKGIIIFLVLIVMVDIWRQAHVWCLKKSQAVFKKALIESGVSVD